MACFSAASASLHARRAVSTARGQLAQLLPVLLGDLAADRGPLNLAPRSPDGSGEFSGDLPRHVRHLPLEFFDPPRDLLHGRVQGRAILEQFVVTPLKLRKLAIQLDPFRVVDHRRRQLLLRLDGRLRFRSFRPSLGETPPAGPRSGPIRGGPFRPPRGPSTTGPSVRRFHSARRVLHVALGPGVGGLLGTSAVIVG